MIITPEIDSQKSGLKVVIENNSCLKFADDYGNYCTVSFQRTLRIPMDGKIYPLPPGLGTFPIEKVEDYPDTVPTEWLKQGGVFLPLYQREAMWISFGNSRSDYPFALKIATGKINSVSGKQWTENIDVNNKEQDYIVTGLQPWLDGINAGDGYIKQFVATPKGSGHSIEQQITGEDKVGGVQFKCFAPKPEKFSPIPPIRQERYECCKEEAEEEDEDCGFGLFDDDDGGGFEMNKKKATEMTISAGGKMKQEIFVDPHGKDTWDNNNTARCFVHFVNAEIYEKITGKPAPSSPIDAKTYTSYNYPWFDYYNENSVGSVPKSKVLAGVKSVNEIDLEKTGKTPHKNESFSIPGAIVKLITGKK